MAAAMVHRQHGIEIKHAAPEAGQSYSLSVAPPARNEEAAGDAAQRPVAQNRVPAPIYHESSRHLGACARHLGAAAA